MTPPSAGSTPSCDRFWERMTFFGIYFTTGFALLLGRRIKRPNARAAKTIEELMARFEQHAAKG